MRFSLLDIFRFLFLPTRQVDVDVADEPTEQQKLPAATLTLVERPLGAGTGAGRVEAPEPSGRQWHDLIGEPRGSRGEAHGSREWSKIKGITIHQTAVDFGTNPRRLLNVPVHGAVLRDGAIVKLHDPRDYMWHAHSFNKYDIGIEVSCRAAGIEGNGETLWLPKEVEHHGKKVKSKTLSAEERLEHADEATDEALEAAKILVAYYVDLVASHGGKIEFIHAHRQSSKSRTSDPGSRIWDAVGKWAIEELGLSAGAPGWAAGGYPLPDAWTGEDNGVRYSWKVRALKEKNT